jgi:hypothetical protein
MFLQKTVFLFLSCAVVLFICGTSAHAQSIPKAGANFTSITNNGSWTWYGNPDAVYYEGKYKKTYMGWISNNGVISVGSYNHATGDTATKVIRTGYAADDHNHPSLLMRPDGRLMVFFSGHDGGILSLYVSTNPEDISAFNAEIQVAPGATYCYPNPMWLSAEGDSGRLWVFYRSYNANPCFTYSDDWGKTWQPTKQYYSSPENTPKPYANYCTNGIDEIHMVIEKGHRAGYFPLYYMKYKKGVFYQASGARIGTIDSLPIMNTKIDTLHDPAKAAQSHGSAWDIALDNTGKPVVVYDQFKDGSNHLYFYFRWTGTSWFKKQLVNSGATMGGEDGFAGGITLDHENTGNIYMSRQVNGMHELDRWTTSDGGTTWDSTAITRGSAKKNTRPCVPRNHKPYGKLDVIWMYGDYSGFTGGGYNTAVKMYPFNETVSVQPSNRVNELHPRADIKVNSYGLAISLSDPKTSSLKIYAPNGRLVLDLTTAVRGLNAGRVIIPYSRIKLAVGSYLVSFKDANTINVKKMVHYLK